MGMTAGRSRLLGSACLLMALWSCGGEDQNSDAPPPEPLIIESPRAEVLVGADTMLVFEPTMLAYFGVNPDVALPSAALMDAAGTFQKALQEAESSLDALGVRTEVITEPPTLVNPNLDAAAGPPLGGSDFGYLFVDAGGHALRVASTRNADQMVCIAAETFGLTLNPQQSALCR